MRRFIAQAEAFPSRAAALPALILLAVAAGACAGPASGGNDAASTPSGGSGGAPATGGSGGQTTQGQGGAAGGAAGSSAAGGGGGSLGTGGNSGRGGASGRDAASRADTGGAPAADGGVLACDDITSPGRLAVYYYSNSAASGSSVQMYFDVVNFTAFSSRLSQVTVRYWFTDETAASANVVEQYYVPLPTTMKFITLSPARQDADTVLEVSFTAAGDAGGSFVETRGFNFAFHKNSYAGTYDQTNDFSYDASLKTTLGQNPRITAYIDGVLSWGCEPL